MATASLFGSQNGFEYFERNLQEIRNEIGAKEYDYILAIDVNKWLEYFKNKYENIPITIFIDQVKISYKNKSYLENSQSDRHLSTPLYHFNIAIPFTGSSFLFFLKPSNCRLDFPTVEIPNGESGTLVRRISLQDHEPDRLEREKQAFLETLAVNTENMNRDVAAYNSKIPVVFDDAYNQIKQKALKERQFLDSLNIEINTTTDRIFKTLYMEKKKVPEPILDKSPARKPATAFPMLEDELYYDIIDIIYLLLKAVEKKPAIYKHLDEEGLRDYILPYLEMRYTSSTVTGETFNKGGKTDILIKHTDGSNLFVAECKFWAGESLFDDTIHQLFDRYLTWRDSKTAIILFVRNKDFSNLLQTIQNALPKNEYYLRKGQDRGESSFSYILHFPGDKSKPVYTQIMAFHFP
jgi:hypothetical protein